MENNPGEHNIDNQSSDQDQDEQLDRSLTRNQKDRGSILRIKEAKQERSKIQQKETRTKGCKEFQG